MIRMPEKALVSACLLGVPCRYDGGHKQSRMIDQLGERYEWVPVCPEEMGGLPTPRPPAEIDEGDGADVLDGRSHVRQVESGADVTAEYLRGAERSLALAREKGATRAYLKSRSPSCGCGEITRKGIRLPGDGVTAALLKRHGIDVVSVDE